MQRPYALGPGSGHRLWFLGQLVTFKASGLATGGRFSVVEWRLSPDAAVPRVIHHRHEQAFYVIAGDLAYVIGDELDFASSGTLVFVPRGLPYSFRAVDRPARLLQICAPDSVEGLLFDLGVPADDADAADPAVEPLSRRLKAAASQHGIEIVDIEPTPASRSANLRPARGRPSAHGPRCRRSGK